MKKICVITGTRAEYGLFYPILCKIEKLQDLQLQLIATTMHLSEAHKYSYKAIEDDGFTIDAKINNLRPKESNVESYGRLMQGLSQQLNKLAPDVVLLLGDRFETHAAATASLLMNIPIAHIHGGEMTEGAVDEQLRHAITKMSHLHFTSTVEYRNRIIQMGELPESVIVCGAPGIDNMLSIQLDTKKSLEKQLNWNFGQKSVLFTYHPETLSNQSVKNQIADILTVIKSSGCHVLFTGANADTGGDIVNKHIEKFVDDNDGKYKMVHNLGMVRYLTALKNVDILVGNSSSGIIEAASFGKPVVNIGDRQKGRLTSGNVIQTSVKDLSKAMQKAFNESFVSQCQSCDNIYGNGHAAEVIVRSLSEIDLTVVKQFQDNK